VLRCDLIPTFTSLPGAAECFSDGHDDQRASHVAYGPDGKYAWQSASKLRTYSKRGKFQDYPGSGYVVLLPSVTDSAGRSQLEELVSELESDHWLDAATRAVFLEFTIFNPHENHFLVGFLLIEYPLSGGAITSWDFEVTPLRRYMNRDNKLTFLLEIVVLLLVLQYAYAEYVQYQRLEPGMYWHSFYNVLDICMLSTAIATYALQFMSVSGAVVIDWGNHDEYLKVERQVWLSQMQSSFYSLSVFFAFLKMFDYLSVFRELGRLLVMIEMMVRKLFGFTLVLGLFMLNITLSEYIAYGYKDEYSYSIQRGFVSRVFGLLSGDPVTYGHTSSDHKLGSFYVAFFLISVSMVLMNLIVAVLTSAYDDARNQSSDVLAQRQFERIQRTAGARGILQLDSSHVAVNPDATVLERFDSKVGDIFRAVAARFQSYMDQLEKARRMRKADQQKRQEMAQAAASKRRD